MSQEQNLFADDPGHYTRFKRKFDVQNTLGNLVNEILNQYENSKMKTRGGSGGCS